MTVERIDPNLYRISLNGVRGYHHVHWRTDIPVERSDIYSVVVLPLDQVLHYAEANPITPFEPPATDWDEDDVSRYVDGMVSEKYSLCMPRVAFFDFAPLVQETSWFGLRKTLKRGEQVHYLDYVNGRHRTRIIEHLGASALPMQCHNEQLDPLLQHMDALEIY